VMDHGQVVEQGTHTALINHAGLYKQMWELQLHDKDNEAV
jgi:ABC-type multidrug transport system fused ATPase/permease subunit